MQLDSSKRKKTPPDLRKPFLKQTRNRVLYERYRLTHDPILLEQLNQTYSNFVNYTVLLSLIHTNIKYKSLHMREKLSTHTQELIPEETLEYLLDQQQNDVTSHFPNQWENILENDQLLQAVSALTGRQQEVLWLLFVKKIPAVEAQGYLNISTQAISRTKQRALSKIKQHMKEGKRK